MKIRLLFKILILTFYCTTGFSQTEKSIKKNSFEFSTGYNSGFLKNLQFAPVSRYEYSGLNYNLSYERTSKKQNSFEVQLDYLNTELKSEAIPQLNSDYSKIGLGFSYLKQIYNKDAFSVHLGFQSQTTGSFYEKGDNYYIADQEFGVAVRFTYQLSDKQFLRSKLTIPLVIFRLTGDFGFDTYSLNRYQSALWNLEYGYSIYKNVDLKLNYDLKYNRLQIPNVFREFQHQINLGFNYKF